MEWGNLMRYEKADNLLQLALEMQARRAGISLQEIENQFGVGRRTAMRMRDAILRNFPQAEEVDTNERVKRWRIPSGVLNQLVNFPAEELADVEAAAELLRRENRELQAANVESVIGKIRALMKPETQRRVEPDLEALLEAEGLAMRPGPRPRVRVMVIEDLRKAIMGCNRVKLKYRRRSDRKLNTRVVEPYGFLHGHRHYLVAWNEHRIESKFLTFALPNIEGVEVLDEMFDRNEDFSLREFSEQSFGVFQEKPTEVVWRFTPEAAQDARDFLFHPSQEFEDQPDGSVIVRFVAGSDIEMAWHLYMWGDKVEVLSPKHLSDMVHGQRVAWQALP